MREPLATTYATRYMENASFKTTLTVWRDSKRPPIGLNGTHTCTGHPAWYPLNQTDVVAFDEQENATDLCFRGDNVSPPTGGGETCFPLEAQRIDVASIGTPYPFGWLYLNLNHTLALGDPYPGRAQAWVTTQIDGPGKFAVGFDATQLDNALDSLEGGVVLIP